MPSLTASLGSGGSTPTAAQLLLMSATGDSIVSGGDYVTFDTVDYQHGFDTVGGATDAFVWPTAAVGEIQVEFAWTTYQDGGKIEIEVDGSVPAWGLLADEATGQKGCKRRSVHITAGSVVRIKVTQTSGSAETANVTMEASIPDPAQDISGDYEATVLIDSPLAYWRLNEGSGTLAADSSGNGRDGTYVGTRTQGASGVMADGSGDAALQLTAVNTSGMAGSDWADLEFGGLEPYSIECWFNAAALGPFFRILVQKQVGTTGAGWELSIGDAGSGAYLTATRGYSVDGNVASAAGTVVVGTDHHAVVTFDGTTARLYLDGVEVGSDTTATSLATNSTTVSIGYDSGDGAGGFGFNGRIDEVAIYGHALTAAAVARHYSIGTGG